MIAASQVNESGIIIVIKNVTLIDAQNGQRDAMTVFLIADSIAKVVPTSEAKIPQKTKVIDGSGKYLIPGLWDAHAVAIIANAAHDSAHDPQGVNRIARVDFVRRSVGAAETENVQRRDRLGAI